MENSIIIKYAETEGELMEILALQSLNHIDNIPVVDRNINGFVTVKHNMELLTKMKDAEKQIIAKHNDILVGYALVMLKEFCGMIPVLQPMFDKFNKLKYKAKPLSDYSFYVMGQICIADSYRGQGIFEELYNKHKESFSNKYEICLTQVSGNNIRSLKAHSKVGFETIGKFKDETDNWHVLLWDWENPH